VHTRVASARSWRSDSELEPQAVSARDSAAAEAAAPRLTAA
jgi:hypothetical protein